MTDARLVGTNPETSELVPVAVNAQGQLKTEFGVIEAIPNDLLVQGDLNVTGTINGNVGEPNSGLPEPYGPEGSVLTIKNGEPAWVVFDSPGVPAANSIFLYEDSALPRVSVEPFGLWDDNEALDNSTLLWDSFIKSTANWADPQAKLVGLGGQNGLARSNITPQFTFRLTCEIGMMLDLYMVAAWDAQKDDSDQWFIEASFNTQPENFIQVTSNYKIKTLESPRVMLKHTFYVNRPQDGYVTFGWKVGSERANSIIPVYGALSKWELYPPDEGQRQQIAEAIKSQREQAANS